MRVPAEEGGEATADEEGTAAVGDPAAGAGRGPKGKGGPEARGWRQDAGRVGVWLNSALAAEDPSELAAGIERLGFGALWLGGGNADETAFDRVRQALAGTGRLVVATGITSIWAWEAPALARLVGSIEEEFPGRFLLGLGVSHAPLVRSLGRRYERPLEAMSAFLGELAEASSEGQAAAPVVLAALGPRMLELARDSSAGAHPYLTTPAHTARARQVLGSSPFLAPEQAVVLEQDPARARSTARAHLSRYLRLSNYRRNLLDLGYGEEELAGEGSDRLVDEIVAHGSPGQVAHRVSAHLAAGADHVCIQPLGQATTAERLDALEQLAPLLLGRPRA